MEAFTKGTGKGRARDMTQEELEKVETLGPVLSLDQTADYFGIPRAVFTRMMDRQPEIRDRYNKGKARAIGRVASNLIQKALDGDKACMMFFLKTQAGWRETQGVDHTSSDGTAVMPPAKIVVQAPKQQRSPEKPSKTRKGKK